MAKKTITTDGYEDVSFAIADLYQAVLKNAGIKANCYAQSDLKTDYGYDGEYSEITGVDVQVKCEVEAKDLNKAQRLTNLHHVEVDRRKKFKKATRRP